MPTHDYATAALTIPMMMVVESAPPLRCYDPMTVRASIMFAALALATIAGGVAAADEPSPSKPLVDAADAVASSLAWKLDRTYDADAGRKRDPIPGARSVEQLSFRSVEPLSKRGRRKTYLRLSLRRYQFASTAAATAAVKAFVDSADTNTGHTYGWDTVIASGTSAYWLHGPCLLSGKNFARAANNLRKHAGATESVECQCGGGCRVESKKR